MLMFSLQVEEHALSAMHPGKERVDSNIGKSIRDQDFALMGWTYQCCIEAMSTVVKAVKDHVATET